MNNLLSYYNNSPKNETNSQEYKYRYFYSKSVYFLQVNAVAQVYASNTSEPVIGLCLLGVVKNILKLKQLYQFVSYTTMEVHERET